MPPPEPPTEREVRLETASSSKMKTSLGTTRSSGIPFTTTTLLLLYRLLIMRLGILALTVAILSPCIMSSADSAPCPSETVTMDVGTTTDLQNMATAINCTGEGAFHVTWNGRLELIQIIELSDKKNLTITGSAALVTGRSAATIDAGNTTGLFLVSGGSTLRLLNLVLTAGSSAGGGAIDVRSSSFLTVVGCFFTNNIAATGGAILVNSSEIHIGGTTLFERNTAQGRGGAIAANQSKIYIQGQTMFVRNSAEQDGGVFFLDSTELHIGGHTSFTENAAGASGATIYGSNAGIYIAGETYFAYNSAFDGGAVYTHTASQINITGYTVFRDNSAGNFAGALHTTDSTWYIEGNTSFKRNTAGDKGGVIYAVSSDVVVNGSTSCANNSAGYVGGCIFSSATDIQFGGNTSFENNVAGLKAGAVSAQRESEIHFDGYSSFRKNRCHSNGGVFFLHSTELHIGGHTSFTENAAGASGATIYGSNAGIYIAGETYFAYNSAAFDGGAVYTHTASQINITGYTVFRDNSAGNFAGAVYTADSTWYIEGNTSFERNTAGGKGGAISAPSGGKVFIRGITSFSGNVASSFGGAVYAALPEFDMNGNTSFLDNIAYDGGALSARDASIHIHGHTTFSGNNATHNGGAINMLGCNATIMGMATISSNTALNGGGIFSALSPNVEVVGVTSFVENSAVLDGGAISLTDPIEVHIIGASFFSNQALFGGAVSLASTIPTTGGLQRCQFETNDASNGGALYLSTGGTSDTGLPIFVEHSMFRHNIADGSGGAIFNVGSLTIQDTVFAENTAADGGLAIANQEPPLDLGNVTFHGNMLSCPPDEYSDFEQEYFGGCRMRLVCKECFDGCEIDRSTTTIASDEIPSCRDIPVGVSRVSTTTLETFDLLPGYFRVSADSRIILECYRKESCSGGDNALDYCATGYTGPYCAVCADGYLPGMLNRCHKCSTEHRGLAMGLATGVLVVAIGLAVWLVSRLLGGEEGRERVRCWETLSSGYTFVIKALPLSAIKIVVVVLQIITQFTEIAGAVYPDEYEAFLSKMAAINLDIGFILSSLCIVKTDFYDRLVFATVGPPIALSALSITSYIMRHRNRNSDMVEPMVQRKHLATGLFVVFFVYASVSFTIFQTFVCEDLDDGNAYLRADYSVQCWTEKHATYTTYASVMVCVYPVGVPALFAWWLARNRHNLEEPDRQEITHLQPFRSLWAAYKPSCYYYEVVECSRRVVLTGTAVFVLPNTADQIAVVLLVAVIFMFISESLSPFENKYDMWLYRWGNAIILISMYVALLLKVQLSREESETSMAMTTVLIMANIFMIATVIVQVVLLVKGLCLSRRAGNVHRVPTSSVWPAQALRSRTGSA